MQYIISFFENFVDMFVDMSAYIMLGIVFVGLLNAFVKRELVLKHLGTDRFSSVVKASIVGVPLPLCSCGVVPTAVGLKKSGASNGAVVSFLISTPQTGVDSILATYSLMGIVMAIFRPIAAFFSGIFGGIVVNIFAKHDKINTEIKSSCGCESSTEEHSCSCGSHEEVKEEEHSCCCGSHEEEKKEEHSCCCGGAEEVVKEESSCCCGSHEEEKEEVHACSCGCGGEVKVEKEEHSCCCGSHEEAKTEESTCCCGSHEEVKEEESTCCCGSHEEVKEEESTCCCGSREEVKEEVHSCCCGSKEEKVEEPACCCGSHEEAKEEVHSCCCGSAPQVDGKNKLVSAMKSAFGNFLNEMVGHFLIGMVLAALITTFVPADFFVSLGLDSGIVAMIAMVIIGIPMYICSVGAIPIAISLVAKGLSFGSAFVFLFAGPVTNIASILVLSKALGKKITSIYVGVMMVCSIGFGLLLDFLIATFDLSVLGVIGSVSHGGGIFSIILAVVFAIMIVRSLGVKVLKKVRG